MPGYLVHKSQSPQVAEKCSGISLFSFPVARFPLQFRGRQAPDELSSKMGRCPCYYSDFLLAGFVAPECESEALQAKPLRRKLTFRQDNGMKTRVDSSWSTFRPLSVLAAGDVAFSIGDRFGTGLQWQFIAEDVVVQP